MVSAVIDKGGRQMVSHGSTGITSLAMNGDTVFEIGSITKVLAALLLTEMAERGEVAMDDPVSKYLPPGVALKVRGRPITLLDLATYTSGLPRMPVTMPPGWNTRPSLLAEFKTGMLFESLANYLPEREPGSYFEYSNLGFGLLGAVLERRAGKSFEELLIERICKPLGLEHTRITLTPDMQKQVAQGHGLDMEPIPLWEMPGLQGAGAVRASANDLLVFLEACVELKQTQLRGALMRLTGTRSATGMEGTDAALGWFISSNANEEIVWKSGVTGGFCSCVAYSTRSRRGSLVISNFLWRSVANGPIDAGTIEMSMKLINPDFVPGDFAALYR
jgi:CubicO group peptidase (beta-lactamase class C family)